MTSENWHIPTGENTRRGCEICEQPNESAVTELCRTCRAHMPANIEGSRWAEAHGYDE